eukprot:scaffold7979_cov49-Attheya_sp.AAC.1
MTLPLSSKEPILSRIALVVTHNLIGTRIYHHHQSRLPTRRGPTTVGYYSHSDKKLLDYFNSSYVLSQESTMVKSFFFLLVCILVVPLVDGTCVNVQPVTTIDFSNNLGGGSTNGIGSGNDWPDLVWTQTPSSAFASNPATSCADVNDFSGFSGQLWLDISFEVPSYAFEGPGDLQMSFVHQYDIESEFDGGNVKFILDDGFLQIKNSAFSENGYNEQLKRLADDNTNPLEGQDAFSGKSDGYVTSDLSLSRASPPPFAGGDLVRLRFELGMDQCGGKHGWDIQSAEIRICFCNSLFCPVPLPEPSPQPSPQPSPAPLSEPSPKSSKKKGGIMQKKKSGKSMKEKKGGD